MLDFLETPLTILHIFVSFFLVLVVLIQPGKSGGIGAALGGAGAQQVFGGRGAGNFLSRTTWVSAAVFFLTSMTLAYLSSSTDDSLIDRAEAGVIPVELPSPAPVAAEGDNEERSADTQEPAPRTTEEDEAAPADEAGEASPEDVEGSPAAPEPNDRALPNAAPDSPKPSAEPPTRGAVAPIAPKPAIPTAPKPAVASPRPTLPSPFAPAAPRAGVPAPAAAPKPAAPAAPAAPVVPAAPTPKPAPQPAAPAVPQ
jgi:preprotein translocase subunit SecG